jgi:hypothetical protein
MSTLKSQLMPEKYRATILRFFRVPVNIIINTSLIVTKYITTNLVYCFFFFMCISTVNVYLIKVHVPPDATHRRIKKTSELGGDI